MENTKKVAYYSDGTNNEIEIKIFALLNKLGGIGELKEFGNSPISGYFFIDKTNHIVWDSFLPEGYTLGSLDEVKPCIKGDGTEEYGEKIKEYLIKLGGDDVNKFTGQDNKFYFIAENGVIAKRNAPPAGYTEISLKEPEKKDYDLAELLKGCEGQTFYHVNHGMVKFLTIGENSLSFDCKDNGIIYVTKQGYWCEESQANGGEVLIFPSKENRDWSSWKKPVSEEEKHEKEIFQKGWNACMDAYNIKK